MTRRTARLTSVRPGNASVVLRAADPLDGPVIATLTAEAAGDRYVWHEATAPVEPVSGPVDLYAVFGSRECLRDPTSELPDGVPFVGATNWGRPVGHPAPDRPGAPSDRDDRRPGSRPVPPCPVRRISVGHGRRRAQVDPALVVRTELTQEAGQVAARELLSRPDRPTAGSPATTCRRSASTRPRGKPGYAFPRT